MLLLLAVALLIFAACAALANHVTCSYKPGNDSPYAYDYIRFCIAARGTNKTGDTEFRCQPGEFASGTPLVATWNVLGQGILEMVTPCGAFGYGKDNKGRCKAPTWATCLGDSDKGDCYYLNYADDCQWPKTFSANDLTQTIEVWSYLGSTKKKGNHSSGAF